MKIERMELELPQKRKMFFRSSGSFTAEEEKIVAPTPRKVSVPSSPKNGRRGNDRSAELCLDEVLFGEAGFELQSILLQSCDSDPPSPPPEPEQKIEKEETVKSARVVSPPLRASNPISIASPPLRSSNPITMNSPFHTLIDERVMARMQPSGARVLKMPHITKRELNRSRSASWPSVPKMTRRPTLLKA